MRILALNRRVSRRASENQAVRAALAAYLTLTLLLAVYLALPGVEDLNRPVLAACALTTLVWTMSNFVVAPVGPRAEPMFAIGTVVALVVIPVAIAASGASQSPLRALMLPLIVFWAWFYGARRALMAIAVVMTVHLAPLAYDPDAFTGAGLGWTLTLTATFAICGGTMVVARRALARLRDAARAEALRDPLTNLANRRSLMSFLQRRSTRRRGGDGALGLIMIDLDGFKAFNTLHGHAGGDAALIAVARALRHTMRDPDHVARLGGDEFAVAVPDADPSGLRIAAQRAIEAIAGAGAELGLEGTNLGASAGIALLPQDADDTESLLKAADDALGTAKRTGKGRVVAAIDRPRHAAA